MELNNPNQVIQLAECMLRDEPLFSNDGKTHCGISLRRRATMRMYVREAIHMLGISENGFEFLNDTDAIDSTAAHLAMINLKKKRPLSKSEVKRLNNAKASIHATSAITELNLGNVEKARSEAQSALNISTEIGIDTIRHASQSSLIQALIHSGKIDEAVELAHNLK